RLDPVRVGGLRRQGPVDLLDLDLLLVGSLRMHLKARWTPISKGRRMLRSLLSRRALATAFSAAGLALAACSWAVPADPGLKAARRGGGFGPEAFATAPDGAGG